ncbi:hypothetical protein M0802_001950 [Mischocyttarus mexicanus]|nr:hypothetical protein M0802_001950 [Mischocyttarus mexicanus]
MSCNDDGFGNPALDELLSICRASTRNKIILMEGTSGPKILSPLSGPRKMLLKSKITKPLLERKRRARINQCLDELKDLMVDAHETEGENISKLEKAEILELTINPNLSTTLIDLDHSTLIPCPCPISPISQTDMNIPISVNKTDHSSIDVKKTRTFKNTSNVIETNIGSLKDCTRFIDNDQIKLSVIKENRKNSIVKRKTIHSQRINMEEEEEIDVERVDDDDLMWRPW